MSNDDDSVKGFQKALNFIEKVGNALPHPIIIFVIMSGIVIVLSHIFAMLGSSVTYLGINPTTMEQEILTVTAVSLLSAEGIRHIFTTAAANFVGFAPLGVCVVAMVGVGVAENSGLISTLIRKLLNIAPKNSLTFVIIFLGILSSVATDAGYLVLIPLGAAIFHSAGRHPIAGLAAAFAGVSASFAANIIVTPIDGILTELTNESIALIDPSIQINILSNYYFSVVSTFLIAIVATIVTTKIIEPRLGKYEGNVPQEINNQITDEEKKGLKFALIGFIITAAIISYLIFPANAPLRNPETSEILGDSPAMSGLIFIIMLLFLVPGICYGYGAKTIKNTSDIAKYTTDTMASLAGFFMLAFVIGQFISYFNFSRLATILAVNGANTLEAIGLGILPLILAFILFCGLINFLIGSASAKYAIVAPIFVPMFMQMGISPALTQAAFRVGDSTTNIISPLMTYFALIVVYAEKYDKKAGLGTIIATMLPYTVWLTISWTLLLILWYFFNLPLGPGGTGIMG